MNFDKNTQIDQLTYMAEHFLDESNKLADEPKRHRYSKPTNFTLPKEEKDIAAAEAMQNWISQNTGPEKSKKFYERLNSSDCDSCSDSSAANEEELRKRRIKKAGLQKIENKRKSLPKSKL